ncbi:MAG: beta-lactamase family protein [Acidobacteriota bacterium]|nr:MAG: beta-lactamase family protein [Acidobacteriota bacterium]
MTSRPAPATALRRAVERCVQRKHFPGAVYLVARGDAVLSWEAVGRTSPLRGQGRPMTLQTVFDLASLTKPIVTASLFLQLMAEGSLRPSDRAEKFFPELRGRWIGKTSLKELLLHVSGLPAWHPLYVQGRGRQAYLSVLKSLPPAYPPGRKVEYSCLGYILLGFILERVAGKRLDALFGERIARPLGLRRTRFRLPASWKARVAPTERGNALEKAMAGRMGLRSGVPWRTRVLHGECHDGNTYHLGGVAGNSGLFSAAWDLYVIARSLLRPDDGRVVPEPMKRLIFRDATGSLRGGRTLGWKTAAAAPEAEPLSENAVGHNGFSGASLWIDSRDRGVYILLTNRVHPKVKPEGIRQCRREFHRYASRLH